MNINITVFTWGYGNYNKNVMQWFYNLIWKTYYQKSLNLIRKSIIIIISGILCPDENITLEFYTLYSIILIYYNNMLFRGDM